jgi:hypothetical protein
MTEEYPVPTLLNVPREQLSCQEIVVNRLR